MKKLLTLAASTFLFAGAAHAQTFNIYESNGTLENAWNDWSWCTDNLASTAYSYAGNQSIQVTYTAGYQGFSLESSTSFQAGYFSNLSFYVNGGTTAGRSFVLQLTVNGNSTNAVNLNNYIAGGKVPANAWAHVSVPLSAFNLKPTDQISRFWIQESSGAAQPSFWLDQIGWTPNVPPTTAITVNPATVVQTLTPEMFGVNTAVWDNNLDSTACKNLVAQSGFKSYRFPGGSLSDGYNWATNTTDSNTWTWATNFDQFANFASSAKGEAVITVNYGTGTAAEAASWVTYSNKTHSYGMKRWEIGNECYGSWEEDSHSQAHDPVTYANQFALYYKQMKAADPTIQIGAVVVAGEDSYANYSSEVVKNPVTGVSHSGWTPVLLATLAKQGVTPDFLSYHRYPEYIEDCDFTLFAGNNTWVTDLQDLKNELTDYIGKTAAANTQILCTENNCDAGTEGKQMCSLTNGLYMADSFGSAMNANAKGFMWWDLINGQNTTGDNGSWLYGWRNYGDEGVMSPDFATTYPVFYMESLLNTFAQPNDQVISCSTSYPLLSAYATKRSDGTIRLLVINKSPTAPIVTNISIQGFTFSTSAPCYQYGQVEDNQAKVGKSQSLGYVVLTVGPTRTQAFPPYSASVIIYSPLNP